MEYDAGEPDRNDKCCQENHRIPCCRSTPRGLLTCIFCTPILFVLSVLVVLAIWSEVGSTGDPPSSSGAKATLIFTGTGATTSAADISAALNANQTSQSTIGTAFEASFNGTSVTSVSASASGTKQDQFSIEIDADDMDLLDIVDETAAIVDSELLATFVQTFGDMGFSVNMAPVFSVGDVSGLTVNCIVKGLEADGISAPLCRGTVMSLLDTNKDEVKTELGKKLPDYDVMDVGLDSSKRLWVQLNYTGDSILPMFIDCAITTIFQKAIEDLKDFVNEYSPSCDVSTDDLFCSVIRSGNDGQYYYKDFRSACSEECDACSAVSGCKAKSEWRQEDSASSICTF